MARWPLDTVRVLSPYGVRPMKGYPFGQGHWGVDLSAPVGAVVRAPEAMTVTAVWHDDATPPWVGYGPGGVEGIGESGYYHLLAHLDPATIDVAVGDRVDEGWQVGTVSTLSHAHWEVRKVAVDNPDTRAGDTINPALWVATRGKPGSSAWLWVVALWLLARS